MALYFEDLNVGDTFESAARTITEADVVNFASLSGDWNPIHTDAEYARATALGRRVAHGLLGLSAMTGLTDRTGIFSGTAIALLGIEWRFTAPIFIGDTIRFKLTISEKRLASDGKRGIVGRDFVLLNQRDEVVQNGKMPIMMRLRGPIPA